MEASLDLSLTNEFDEMLNSANGERKDVIIMASISSTLQHIAAHQNPLELVVVIDRSGSMSGEKLNLCISSIQFVIKELGPNDFLSLVTFEESASIVFGLTKMNVEGKQVALNKLSTVSAGGGTSISAGLLKGMEVLVESSRKTKSVADDSSIPTRSLMLLTDGLDGSGESGAQQLVQLCKTMMNDIQGEAGATVHCFSFGTDADVDYCSKLAQGCGGMYYAVSEIKNIDTAFHNCLGGLLSVSAQNVKFIFTPASPDIEVKEVLTKFANSKDPKTGVVTVIIPDMYSEESRDILFRLNIGSSETELMKLGELSVVFLDVKFKRKNVMLKNSVLPRPKVLSQSESAGKQNEKIGQQLIRIEAAQSFEQAKGFADTGNFASAKRILEAMLEKMKEKGIDRNNGGLMGGIMNDLETVLPLLNNSEYQQHGKAKLAGLEGTHTFQRSNAVTVEEAKNSAYMTTSRIGMIERGEDFSNSGSNNAAAIVAAAKIAEAEMAKAAAEAEAKRIADAEAKKIADAKAEAEAKRVADAKAEEEAKGKAKIKQLINFYDHGAKATSA